MEGREVMRCGHCYEWVASVSEGWCPDCFVWSVAGILREYREVFGRLAKT